MQMKPIERGMLINATLLIEGFLLLIATAWSWLVHLPLIKSFHFNVNALLLGASTGVLMAASAYGLYYLSRKTRLLSQLRETVDNMLVPMVADLRPFDIVLIAVLSGFCEEVLFRGVAQPQLGLVLAALAFGLFHDPTFRNVTYLVLAFLYGIVLGLLFAFTGSLWAPICAHMVHNLIALTVARYLPPPPAAAEQR